MKIKRNAMLVGVLWGMIRAIVFVAIFCLSAIIYIQYVESFKLKKNVESMDTNGLRSYFFPILVVSKDQTTNLHNADIMYMGETKNFLITNQNRSYLIPRDQEANIKKQIENKYVKNGKKSILLKIREDFKGKQYFQIKDNRSPGRVNISWYEATDKQIIPKYHLFYFRPELINNFTTLRITLLISVVFYLIMICGEKIIRFIVKKKFGSRKVNCT